MAAFAEKLAEEVEVARITGASRRALGAVEKELNHGSPPKSRRGGRRPQ